MIPLNQTAKVNKAAGLDEWGQPTAGRTLTLKCRIDGSTQAVKTPNGKEVVSNATLLFKGLVQIGYGDLIEWKDETGNTYTLPPLNVTLLRDYTGKPLFTKVVV